MKSNAWMWYLGGAAVAFWALNNFGPSEGVSYWDSWFGGSQPQPLPQPQAPTQGILPITPDALTSEVARSRLKEAMAHAAGTDESTPEQWEQLRSSFTGTTIPAERWKLAFPGNLAQQVMHVDGFMWYLDQVGQVDPYTGQTKKWAMSGLGYIVPTGSVPSIPSMSFGGSLRRPGALAVR